jgi:hypothetical protein
MVNAIASTLEAAELPLTDEQVQSLQTVGVDFTTQDKARLAAYSDDDFQLQMMVDETVLKDRFFEQAFALLTPEQFEVLSPEETRDRTRVDIFSSALLWAGRVRMEQFSDDANLAEKVTGYLARGLELDESQKDTLHNVATDWVASLPTELKEGELDALAKNGMLPKDTVVGWATQVVELWRRAESKVELSDEARQELRQAGRTPVLFRRTDGG